MRHHPASSIIFRSVVVVVVVVVIVVSCCVKCEDAVPDLAAARAGLCDGGGTVASRSCFRIAADDEVDFFISPEPQTTSDGTYYFHTRQRVTLTCKVKDATGAEGRNPSMFKAVVFIQSCFCGATGSSCPGWVTSVPGPSESQLNLSGLPSAQPHGCQFACWLLDPDCPTGTTSSGNLTSLSDLTVPGLGGCTLAALSGTFYTLQFGEQPALESFECLSRNWAGLECQWTFSISVEDNHVNCSLSYVYRSDSGDSTSSLVKIAVTGQELTQTRQGKLLRVGTNIVDDEDFRRDRQYSFHVAVSTSYGLATVVTNITSDASIVKLSAARNLTVTADDTDPAILHVTWQLLEEVCDLLGELSDGDLEFSVFASSVETWMHPHNVTVDFVENGDFTCDRRVTVTRLRPFTNYSVTVRYRVPASDIWGDVATSSGRTSEDRPSEGPAVMAGGFVTWSCGTVLCLTVYFGEVPTDARNGAITGYKASLLPFHNGRPVLQGTSLAESRSVTLTGAAEGGQVCVAAGTSKGFSAAASCFLVPDAEQQDVPDVPSSVTARRFSSNHTYVIRWRQTGSAADGVHRQTVFWCVGRVDHNTTVKCTSKADWAVVPATTTVFVLNASNMADIGGDNSGSAWYFGVNTLSVDNRSRGIAWNKCSYLTKAAGQTVVPKPGNNRRLLSSLTADADYFTCFCADPEASGSDVCTTELPTFFHNGLTSGSVAGIVIGGTVSVVFFALIIRWMQRKYAQKSGLFAPYLGFEMPDGVATGFNTPVYAVTNPSSGTSGTRQPNDATFLGNAHTSGESCDENVPAMTKPEIRPKSEAVAPWTVVVPVPEPGKSLHRGDSGFGGSGSEPMSGNTAAEDTRAASRDAGCPSSSPLKRHDRTGLPFTGYFSLSDISSVSTELSAGDYVRASISDLTEVSSDRTSATNSERVGNSKATSVSDVCEAALSAVSYSMHANSGQARTAEPERAMDEYVSSLSCLGQDSVSNSSSCARDEEFRPPSRRVENLQYVSAPDPSTDTRISSPAGTVAVLRDQGRQSYTTHRHLSPQDYHAGGDRRNSTKYVTDVFARFSAYEIPANADSDGLREMGRKCETVASVGSLSTDSPRVSGSEVFTIDPIFDAGSKLQESVNASAVHLHFSENSANPGREIENYTRLTIRDDFKATRASSAYVNPASLGQP